MKTVKVVRDTSDDEGTFGKLFLGDWECYTGELPWRENQPGISCVPKGTYTLRWGPSPKWGSCYHMLGVVGRENVEVHSGNWCGDKSMGYKSDVEGCIILGSLIGTLSGQKALTGSIYKVTSFNALGNREDIQLTIVGVVG